MGKIFKNVRIENPASPDKQILCLALVDTGASHMTLPAAWRERLGNLEQVRNAQLQTASQGIVNGAVCGPVKIQLEGFEPVFSEVVFIDMEPLNGEYEPLIGFLVLEASAAGVDMLGHRLIHLNYLYLK
jgi:predicted aspartyl protease